MILAKICSCWTGQPHFSFPLLFFAKSFACTYSLRRDHKHKSCAKTCGKTLVFHNTGVFNSFGMTIIAYELIKLANTDSQELQETIHVKSQGVGTFKKYLEFYIFSKSTNSLALHMSCFLPFLQISDNLMSSLTICSFYAS